ncbi:methionine--tRNA ligase [Silvanigrella paludirubra]|uniref:Methionine--tRNA ligase n=1 Tax=Silvanigrella paludirubra TaxID=2499159 RepID=A0A6N6VPV6_9BACT|nr:methionine--tRNA ligase [Silvanigrella paludirubra]KAB8037054.1 methionine--tRNA ligase [Silvanigrella paludirubra]
MATPCRYFTTPIYYANGSPHAGHVYATILTSILKTHYSQRGENVKFLTGLDEHGEAVQDKAKELEISPQKLVDDMAILWKKEFARFELNNDIFIRTTDKDHVKNVQDILNYCHKKGDIYFGEHEGYYCIKCEGFLTNSERDENNNCLVHKRPTELRKEKNYFFRTSKYRDKLIDLISQGKITHQEKYKNELLGMLKNLEGDLSISRPKTRLTWGIELPFDKEHVAYVWFDALPNYVTGIGGLDQARTSEFWKNVNHIIGKDIIKFHGIFWPAMCLSLDIPLPKLLITGWLLKDAHKMSKSLGNVVTVDQILHYGRDMFVNFVFRATNPGDDIDISWKSYFERYNSDLANGVGNLLSRTLAMIEKYFERKIPKFHLNELNDEQKEIVKISQNALINVTKSFDEFRIADAMNEISNLVSLADKLIANQKPWEIAKNNDEKSLAQLENILATCVGVLRTVGYLSYSFHPSKMNELLLSIGENLNHTPPSINKVKEFTSIYSGFVCDHIPKLFNRIDIAAELAAIEPDKKKEIKKSEVKKVDKSEKLSNIENKNSDTNLATDIIQIQDFSKVQMRVGTVVSAECVDGSDKLLKLVVSLGEFGERQIFSGIREWVKPEEVVNHKVIIVCNLAPRKMRFGTSEGMMLSTDTIEGKISPVFLPEYLKEGSLLS